MQPDNSPTPRNRNSKCVCFLLALFPLAALLLGARHYFVNLPMLDQWYIVPMFQAYEKGTIGFADLWEPVDNHRSPFPRAIMLILGVLTKWNHAYEVALSILLAVASLLLLWGIYSRSVRRLRGRDSYFLLPVFSVLLFSFTQIRNWTWGWQLHLLLLMFLLVACVYVLSAQDLNLRRFSTGFGLSFLATFTFASGILVWAACLPLVVANPRHSLRRRVALGLIWSAGALAAYALYYSDFSVTKYPTLSFFSAPTVFSRYTLAVLGAPICYFDRTSAILAGGAGLLVFAGLAASWDRSSDRGSYQAALPFLCLGIFATLSAAAVAYGRGAIYPHAMMASKYTTFSMYFWLALLALAFLRARQTGVSNRGFTKWRSVLPVLGLTVLVLGLALSSSVYGYLDHRRIYVREKVARDVLVRASDSLDEVMRLSVVPKPMRADAVEHSRFINELVPFLESEGLSAFLDKARLGEVPVNDYRAYAQDLLRVDALPGAIATYRTLIHFLPDEPRLYFELAQIEERAGRRKAAMTDCYKALELDPSFGSAVSLLQQLNREILEASQSESRL